MVFEIESEASSGILVRARVLWISQLLDGSWRTRDLAGELDEGFSEPEVADYAERRLKASRKVVTDAELGHLKRLKKLKYSTSRGRR